MTKKEAIDIMASCAVYVVEKVDAPWHKKFEICKALQQEQILKDLCDIENGNTKSAMNTEKYSGTQQKK